MEEIYITLIDVSFQATFLPHTSIASTSVWANIYIKKFIIGICQSHKNYTMMLFAIEVNGCKFVWLLNQHSFAVEFNYTSKNWPIYIKFRTLLLPHFLWLESFHIILVGKKSKSSLNYTSLTWNNIVKLSLSSKANSFTKYLVTDLTLSCRWVQLHSKKFANLHIFFKPSCFHTSSGWRVLT